MKITDYNDLKHGMKVTAIIHGIHIYDAKISINKNGDAYVCQDTFDEGSGCDDKLGYKCGCVMIRNEHNDSWIGNVNEVNIVETLTNLKYGDILKSKDGKHKKILGICGEIYFLSTNDFSRACPTPFTKRELEEQQYIICEGLKIRY